MNILGSIILTETGLLEWSVQSTEGAYIRKHPSCRYGIRIVASGSIYDWAAYYGPLLREDNTEEILRTGDKLGEAAARSLFAWLLHKDYRR